MLFRNWHTAIRQPVVPEFVTARRQDGEPRLVGRHLDSGHTRSECWRVRPGHVRGMELVDGRRRRQIDVQSIADRDGAQLWVESRRC